MAVKDVMACYREPMHPGHKVLWRQALVLDGGACAGLRLEALLTLLVPPGDRQECHAHVPRGCERLHLCVQRPQ